MRILFYAINHVGLGHVARLSVVQRFLTRQRLADCYFFSESRHAAAFFSCPGLLFDLERASKRGRNEHVSAKERWHLLQAAVRRAIDDVRPDVLVCDTYWSEAATSIPNLMARGGRAVLILRMTDSRLMALRLREARTVFDSILLPHHPQEIRWAYRADSRLLRQLDSPQVVPIGPLCRKAARPVSKKEIIFSLGAGGEWPGASKANTIETFLGAFAGASRLLTDHGYPKPTMAAGAFLRMTPEIKARFVVRRTTSLHEHFGPRTVVVTRGGYNTVWEAVAVGSPLVVCGTRNRLDDVKARSEFVQREGVGRSVIPDSRALFKAIVDPWPSHADSVRPWAGIVNAGLRLVADEILGGAILRAREAERGYPASTSPTIMSATPKRLIARFEDVDAHRPSPALCSAARLAIEQGYDTRLCLVHGSDGAISRRLVALRKDGAVLVPEGDKGANARDCVRILVWPGPRVRNELRISEEIADKQKRGVNTGLGIHADRVPLFLVEYFLRAFSLHNQT